MKRIKLFVLVGFLFIGNFYASACEVSESNPIEQLIDGKVVNIYQIYFDDLSPQIIKNITNNDQILHIVKEGKILVIYTDKEFDKASLLQFMKSKEIQKFEIKRSFTEERNQNLFKK